MVFAMLLAACLTAPVLYARVFTAGRLDLRYPATFGRLIYQTLMEINGGKAEVNVVACTEGPTLLDAALRAHRDPAIQVVSINVGEDKPPLLVTVVQSPSDRDASRPAQARHGLADVPVPADGVILSTMRSGDTRTTFERLSSRQGVDEVIRFFEERMGQTGWTKWINAGEGSGFSFYIKGADVCVVRVVAKESHGETGITLLHKQGAVK